MIRMLLAVLGLAGLSTLVLACGTTDGSDNESSDVLFQVSTLDALAAGDFHGKMSYGDLGEYGDFGLGTFEALDGEMVAFDGTFHQVRADGRAYEVDGETLTPFAAVTSFEGESLGDVDATLTCAELQGHIDDMLEGDGPVAVAVRGSFAMVHTRSVEPQPEPYPTLEEALDGQVEFELFDTAGTIVGFRLPEYMAGANAAGYHFHFITESEDAGGHVLDCETESVRIFYDEIDSWEVELTE